MSEIKIAADLNHYNNDQMNRVYDVSGISPTVLVVSGGGREIKIMENEGCSMNNLKVNDFFSGCGGMGLGFKLAGFDIAGAWDFDKYAVESYKHNVGDHVLQADITKMSAADIQNADVWTFGFPCQDISVAGNQKGMIKGETRSGLFYEVMRLLNEVEDKPKIILAENVKALKKLLPILEEEYKAAGYKMYYTLYNSKYWGVPQNRERYFVVGVHESIVQEFEFPIEQKKYIPRLSTILESEVDEKYYIDPEKTAKIIEQAKAKVELDTTHAVITPDRVDKGQNGRRAKDEEEESYTLTAQDRHGVILKVKEATKKGYAEATIGDSINLSHPNSKTRRGRVGKQVAQTLLTGQEQVVVEPQGINVTKNGSEFHSLTEQSVTLCARDYKGLAGKQPSTAVIENSYRIRKLTVREYARLQGFPESYEIVVSNSQAYKQFGNAVSAPVAQAIAERIKMFLLSL